MKSSTRCGDAAPLLAGNDHVIQEPEADLLRAALNAPGDGGVLIAWFRRSARMVVRQRHRNRIVP